MKKPEYNKVYKCIIRILNDIDIIGLEECMELKKRFTNLKCISPSAELYRLSMNVSVIN